MERKCVRLPQAWVGPLAALGAALLYGTSWLATGIALHGFTPFTVALWRSVVTVVVLAPLLLRSGLTQTHGAGRNSSAPLAGRLVRLAILGFLGGVAFVIGMNVSILLTGVAITAFIAGAYPVVAAAAAPLVLGERPRPVALLGLALAFLGTLLIAGFDIGGLHPGGAVIGAVTAVGTGFFLLLTRRWSEAWRLSPVSIASSCFMLLGVAGGAVAVTLGTPLLPPGVPLDALLAIVWLGVMAGGVATVLLAQSLRRLPASESSAYLMLNPLTGAVLAVVLLGEALSILQVMGAAILLTGIGLATGTLRLIRRSVRHVFLRDRELAPSSPD